jgi:Transposase DDE domain
MASGWRAYVSRHYVKRQAKTGTGTRETTYSKYPKVVLVTDCRSHLVLAAKAGRGPGSDLRRFRAALADAAGRARIGTLLADADFDAEWVHEHPRGVYGVRTLLPPGRGRPSHKPPAGRWRGRMKQRFDKAKYGQRWQTETINSMIKRRLGSALRARSYWSQCREIILRVITHNVMSVIRVRVFYRAGATEFGHAGVEELGDVRVVHQGQGLLFGLEARNHLLGIHAGLDDLQGDRATDGRLLRSHEDDAKFNIRERPVSSSTAAGIFLPAWQVRVG